MSSFKAFIQKEAPHIDCCGAAISGELTFVISPLVVFEYEGKVYQKIQQGFLKVSKRIADLFLMRFLQRQKSAGSRFK